MKPSALLAAALLVLTLAGCGQDDGETATDRLAPPDQAPLAPTEVPAAPGPVRSRSVPTVMDVGTGPELCLGPVAESYPPQCSGPAIVGWEWASLTPNFEQQGRTRWGTFAVTGTWDGTTFTVTDAVAGALYDPAPVDTTLPTPSTTYDAAELQSIADELTTSLPGAQGGYPDDQGHVLVDVTYDDGTLQDYVDAAYGEGVVVVNGALVDA